MANDVTIVVEASLGDTLLKLELAKAAINDLDDAGSVAGHNLGDDKNRNSFASRLRNVRKELSNMGDRGPLGAVVRGFGNLASAMLAPIQLGQDFAQNFEKLGSVSQVLLGGLVSLPAALIGLAAAMAVATFAATALADALGVVIAIVADFVAPLTIVTSLLGLLGVGFVVAAKRAAEGGVHLNKFTDQLDVLKSMFHRTSTILAQLFLPYLIRLGHAAEIALNFFDKIAKLPLKEAFQRIATQGTQLLTQFINEVSKVVAHPIRLAFKLAFGEGPAANEFQSTVSAWWNRFTGFLFGYVERHPMTKLDILKGSKPTVRTVDGIFQPLIDWFNRHHFTRQGIQIGHQILNGVLNSQMRQRIVDFIVQIFKDAGRQAGRAFISTLNQPFGPILFALVRRAATGIVRLFVAADKAISASIRSSLSEAWQAVADKVRSIWSSIVSFIESPLHISIDWPSPPSWLSHLPGSGIIGGITGAIGGIGNVAGVGSVARVTPRAAMAAPNVFVTIHGADLSDAPTRRRVAQQVGKEIAANWGRRAGGH